MLCYYPEWVHPLARIGGQGPEAEVAKRCEEHYQEVQHLLQHHPLQGRQARRHWDQVAKLSSPSPSPKSQIEASDLSDVWSLRPVGHLQVRSKKSVGHLICLYRAFKKNLTLKNLEKNGGNFVVLLQLFPLASIASFNFSLYFAFAGSPHDI